MPVPPTPAPLDTLGLMSHGHASCDSTTLATGAPLFGFQTGASPPGLRWG